MNKIFLLAGFFIIAITSQAQKTSYGLKAGSNFSTVKTNDDEFNEDRAMRITYHFGIVTDFAVSNKFSVQPQLLLQGKGVSIEHSGHKDKYKFTSLDIPVNLLYRNSGFFLGGGPNLGINLSGKFVSEDDPNDNTTFEFGNEAGKFKRMHVGVNLLTGYQTKTGFFVSANYLSDLTNWSNAANDNWKNSLFGVSVGYMMK